MIAPDSGEDPHDWPLRVAAAIGQHENAQGRASATFIIKVIDGVVKTTDEFPDTSGLPPNTGVLLLDPTDSTNVAPALAYYFFRLGLYLSRPGDTIHFIGHGSGATVLGQMAGLLPSMKIDQFTTLDPFGMIIPANVLFADNYYQTNAYTAHSRGVALSGAANYRVTVPQWSAVLALVDWYTESITSGVDNGYYFVDCPYGRRPLDGFSARSVGRPAMQFVYDAKAKTLVRKFSAGTTGTYYLQWSDDFKKWFTDTSEYLVFDGQAFEYGGAFAVDPLIPKQFFRLVRLEKSF